MVLVPKKYQIDISLQRAAGTVGAGAQGFVTHSAKQGVEQLVDGDGDLFEAHGVIPWLAAKNSALTISTATAVPMAHMTLCCPLL